MPSALVIRPEIPEDVDAITVVTEAAFRDMAMSSHTEHFIVSALRSAGALTISLVAEIEGRVVGHIAFSPVSVSDDEPGWYGLGPVSVSPEHQRHGIGSALIREGLARLRAMGAAGCCLVGHPDYYGRFGFVHPKGLGHDGVPAEAFFALALDGPMPQGTVAFHEGFRAERA
jgi:putative acetyltransferase